MQILKAKTGKSITINHILNNSQSICIIYHTEQLSVDGFFINNKDYSIKDLINFISNNLSIDNVGKTFDYLIIYTNLSELEIIELINWCNNNSNMIDCREILMTCTN